MRLYAPVSSSCCAQLTSFLTGQNPEFFDSKFIAQNAGREGSCFIVLCFYSVTRVQSQGEIKITFHMLLKNFVSNGYSNAPKALDSGHPLSKKM